MELLILSVCRELKRTIAWKCYNYPVRILSLFMLQYLYTGIWHASFALLLVAFFFLTHSRKCQVSILFTLKFCRDEGFNCTRTRFTYDIVKGQFLFSKALSSICFTYLSSAQSSRFAMFSGKGAFFFLKGKLKITAEYWKPVKYLESIWRLFLILTILTSQTGLKRNFETVINGDKHFCVFFKLPSTDF